MKLFICGYARHGKDSAAEFLNEKYGLTFESSSVFCMRFFLRKQLAEMYDITYASDEECFEDRVNRRDLWHGLITAYNEDDLARLSHAIFKQHDIYVGIRSSEELESARHLADLVLWIDRPGWPAESRMSNTLTSDIADVIVSASNITQLQTKLGRLFDTMY